MILKDIIGKTIPASGIDNRRIDGIEKMKLYKI